MEYAIPLDRITTRQRSSALRPLKQFFAAVFLGLFIIATGLGLVNILQPRGLQLVAIRGASMGNTLPPGSLAVLIPSKTYRAGDVVAYQVTDEPLTVHRVVGVTTNGISPTYYQTKGDNNQEIDRFRPTANTILGQVVVAIPLIGYLLAAVQTTLGLIVLVVIPVTILATRQVQVLRRRWHEGQYQSVFHSGPPLVTRYDA